MKILLHLMLPLFTLVAYTQQENFTYCQQVPDWSDFKIDSNLNSDNADILVVTNRPWEPEETVFLPNEIAEWRKVTYLLATCADSNWYVNKVSNFEQAMDKFNTGEDVLLFVHGHGKNFPSTLTRASQVQKRYGVKTILFDWPAQNSNFNKSMARVRRCGENFYNLLLQLEDYKERKFKTEQHLSILAHSLGNYFLTHMVVNGNNQYLKNTFVDNIIFSAPAIKSGEHGLVLSQMEFQKRIYVALNENDRILRGAHLITYGKMLGNVVVKPTAKNTEYIHFTPLVGKQHTFFAGYYQFEFDYPVVFDFYNNALHGRKVNTENKSYYLERPTNDGYDASAATE